MKAFHKFAPSVKNAQIALVALLCCISSKALGAETVVKDISSLNKAISSAKAGDRIIMANGVWKDAVINFQTQGSEASPITLKAETTGKVILTGSSRITFSQPYCVIDGLLMKDGAIEKGSVVSFESEHCTLQNCAIVNYNPADFKTNYYWIYLTGSYNTITKCFFTGKNNMNPVLGNDNDNARHNTFSYNYIKDIPYVAKANGREILRLWGYGHADEMGEDGAYFTVEYNLFERAHGEGTEIVSLKSNFNVVRYNTVIASQGGLVGRRGRNNTFEGNFIFGNNQERTSGIRIAGPNHRVVNNYIDGVSEDGIRLIAGEYVKTGLTSGFVSQKKKPLPKYLQVENAVIVNNTIVNVGNNGIDMGFSYKNSWPELQMVLLPQNCLVQNNLIYKTGANLINEAQQDKSAPLDVFQFAPNKYEGNIIFEGRNSLPKNAIGVSQVNPLLKLGKDRLYRPQAGSPAIDKGIKNDLVTDMDGQPRESKTDIGADEVATSPLRNHPLQPNEVGPEWMKSKK